MEINWRSQQGNRTDDNRDCGGLGIRPDGMLCLVLDGSTSGPTSGEFARQITRDLIDWYVTTDEDLTAKSLTEQLRRTHMTYSRQFPSDSASYVIAHIAGAETALILHAGDCLLGKHEGSNAIQWLIRPHTLANIRAEMPIDEIARSPVRHRLTRSFRAKEFMPPEMTEIKIEPRVSFVVATDGFWAELDSNEQAMFMQGQNGPVSLDGDDRSVLQVRHVDHEQDVKFQFDEDASANFYIKRS